MKESFYDKIDRWTKGGKGKAYFIMWDILIVSLILSFFILA